MKSFLCAVLVISLVIIGAFIYRSYKEKHALSRTVGRIFICGFVIIFFNILTLYAGTVSSCSFYYGFYFIATDWLLYYLLRFSLEYIGNRFEDHVKRIPMLLLLSCDSLSILCNSYFGHLYELTPLTLFEDELYYEMVIHPLFFTHYSIILMLVLFCLISLFYKSFTAPLFYRSKYLSVAIMTLVIVALNVSSFASAIDLSIIGYVIEAVGIYYCTFIYTPQKLLPKTWALVAQDMSIGLFIMDIEGHNLYLNTAAKTLLLAEEPLLDRDGVSLSDWCRTRYLNSSDEFTTEETFSSKTQERILNIQLQRITDTHKQVQGGYFIIQDRTEEINHMKEEYWLSTHDPLTGLYNKNRFCEKAQQYISTHPSQELMILCTDIKDFKMINDFLGAQIGDTVLINFSNILKEQVTKALVFGRIVNDVFAVLIKKADYSEIAFTREEKQDFFSGMSTDISFPIINYVGIYEVTDRTLPVSVMCDRARMAIATVKGEYNKRVAYYNDSIRDNILHEQELISGLNDAIHMGQLQMYLQPQTAADGSLLGAEALVRWIHPQKGMICPGDFIPIFEKNGLISEIDKYIWEAACKQLHKWKTEGRENLYISVNISPRDFYFLNIYNEFTELVQKYDIDSHNLKLEITETAIVMDFERQIELISKLRDAGFTVEMDDFGSGYSSLNMLKDLHVDILKIDMEFLRKASDELRSKKILKMIIELSAQLNMGVITEGVETAEQVAFLSDMGCQMFQGYYFAKPMSVADFEAAYTLPV